MRGRLMKLLAAIISVSMLLGSVDMPMAAVMASESKPLEECEAIEEEVEIGTSSETVQETEEDEEGSELSETEIEIEQTSEDNEETEEIITNEEGTIESTENEIDVEEEESTASIEKMENPYVSKEKIFQFDEQMQYSFSPQVVANLQEYDDSSDEELFGGFTGTNASMPTTGDVNALVFVVDFADKSFSDEWIQNVETYFFGEEDKESEFYPYESLDAYYQRSSFGKLNLDGDFFYYHDPNNRSVYDDSLDPLIYTLIEEYRNAIKEECGGTEEEKEAYLNERLKKYDSNNDGILDGVYINYAGETTGQGSQWWSYVGYYAGFQIGDYTFGSTCLVDSATFGAAVTLIHETGHMLGLADYYGNSGTNVIASTDMMAYNSSDQNGFSKMLLGWIEPENVTIIKDSGYQSVQLNPYASSGELVLIVPNYEESKGLYTEFYMVEYYEAVENDWLPALESHKGLRIYHINAELNENNSFVASNLDYQSDSYVPLIQSVHPDSEKVHHNIELSFDMNIYYGTDPLMESYGCFFTEDDSLTPYTLPASYVYSTNKAIETLGYSGIVVDTISLRDNVASFNVGFESEKSQPKLTYEVIETADGEYSGIMNEKLRFGTDIRLKNNSHKVTSGELLDKLGNKYGDLKISYDDWKYGYVRSDVTITLADEEGILLPGMYTIVIPEGIFITSYGVENEEIRIDYNNGKGEILRGEEKNIVEYSTRWAPQYDSVLDENGNGYVSRIICSEDQTIGKDVYTCYWNVLNNFELVSETKIEDIIDEVGQIYSIELIELFDNMYGWLIYVSNNEKEYYVLYTLNQDGNCISKRVIEDETTGNIVGILDGKLLLGGEDQENKIYLYDFQDERKDTAFEVSFSSISNYTIENGCKRINENSYALKFFEGWVLYDSNNVARIGMDVNGYMIEDITYHENKYYVLTKEGTPYEGVDNPAYVVLVYDSDYCYVDEYVLNAPATDICKIDNGFITICIGGQNGNVQYIYNDSFQVIGMIGDTIEKYSFGGNKLSTLSVEDGELIGRIYDFTVLDFADREPSTEEETLAAPVSNIPSGSVLDFLSLGSVELSSSIEGAEIHYTLDGQRPHRYSSVYENPIKLTKEMMDEQKKITIKAYARKEGYKDSDVVTFTYDIDTVVRGECEGDIFWGLDVEAGELVISGNGDMEDFTREYDYSIYNYVVNSPWYEYNNYIKEISIEEGITSIGNNAFFSMGFLEKCPVLPDGLKKIGESAFEKCYYMEGELTLPTGLDSIGMYAFRECRGINGDLIIPDGVTSIGVQAFEGCSGLVNNCVLLPDSVIEIGDMAFGHYDVTIMCYKGSYADEWAKENDFKISYMPSCLVTFDSAGGTEIQSRNVKENGIVEKPEDPTREGYKFIGWYLDGELYDFTSPVTTDITLEAKWEEIPTVTEPEANIESGSEVESGTEIILSSDTEGASIYYTLDETEPTTESSLYRVPIVLTEKTVIKAIAVKEGYKDSEIATFVYTIAEPEKVIYEVTFNSNGGSEVAGQTVEENGIVEKPEDPTREGYKFIGWYLDGELYDFTSPVTTDITLEAKWEIDFGDILDEDIPDGGVDAIPEGLWIAGVDTDGYIYTGKAIKPEARVYDYKTLLKEKVDYTISYKNNTKAAGVSDEKAPTITIIGKGNYAGTETKAFTILKKNLSSEDIKVNDITVKYNNLIQKLIPVVMDGDKMLSNKKDFTINYPDAEGNPDAYKNAGVYPIEVVGINNYTGSKTVYITITDNTLISKATVAKIGNQTYTGGKLKPTVTVKYKGQTLAEGSDYAVEYFDNVQIGTATAVITGKGAFAGEKKVTFKIIGNSIQKAKVEELVKNFDYTGKEICPTFKVTFTEKGQTRMLAENENYTVSFLKNTDVGTATIVLTGINDFTGTLKKTFKIKAYNINADAENMISVTLPDMIMYEKGGSKPKPIVAFGKTVLTEGKDYTLSYQKNNALNDGSDETKMPTVTIKGKGNFTKSIIEKFCITEKNISQLTISVPDKVYSRKTNGFKSTPVLTDTNGKKLKVKTDYLKDYKYTYAEETVTEDGVTHQAGDIIDKKDVLKVGTLVNVTVEGAKCYTDSITGQYRIIKTDIAKTKVTVKPQDYTGKPITLTKDDITVKLNGQEVDKNEFTIIGYENNIKVGTAKVTIKGVGDTFGGIKTVKFKIESKKISW